MSNINSFIIKSGQKLPKTEYQTIGSLLLDRLKQCYEQTVIIDCESGRKWSGDEVYESALNLSYYLITECLLKPGDVVCFVCADTHIHAIAMLAIWAAGGVYCSLPSHSTYREIDSALNAIEPSYLVTDGYNYGIAATIASEFKSVKRLFLIDEESSSDINTNLDIIESILQFERSFLPLPVDGSLVDTCALTITSACDGSPEAVIRTNRNLISNANALKNSETSDLSSNDIVLITGLNSSTGLGMFLYALNTGSSVAIFDENDRSSDKFVKFVHKYGITSALLTTSQLYLYLQNNDTNNILRDVWFWGTSLSEDIHKKALDLFDNFRKSELVEYLNNKYYPVYLVFSTPEGGWVTTMPLSETNTNYKSIGRPVAGVELKLVDSIGQSVPYNTVGEICVRSQQCTPGYLNNEQESQRLLMDDKFIRSGEYGLFDSDGLFYIVGHSEEFINVEDYRISAEELESILNTQMDVKEAAVIGGEDEMGSEYVKALVTLKKVLKTQWNTDNSPEEVLREFLNLRVDPRKRIKEGGLEILKDSPHPQMRRFSFKKRDEQFC